jgi:DNA processing protein
MITELCITDTNYPQLLKQIKNAPKKVYLKGACTNNLFIKSIAIVGSRNVTQYGEQVLRMFLKSLVSAGITTISGFSVGVDALVHSLTLEYGGKTVAVMPCGIDNIYPANQKRLYNKVQESGGLILSEYPGEFGTAKWTYVLRNRIVAGLVPAVLVIEARKDSGTLITARYAKKFGRRVLVVPNGIFSKNSSGIVELLRDGAYPIESPGEIISMFNWGLLNSSEMKSVNSRNILLSKLTPLESSVIQVLQACPLSINDIQKSTKLSLSDLVVMLTEFELQNLITIKGGIYYVNQA